MTYEFIWFEFMYMKNFMKSYLKSWVPRFQMNLLEPQCQWAWALYLMNHVTLARSSEQQIVEYTASCRHGGLRIDNMIQVSSQRDYSLKF